MNIHQFDSNNAIDNRLLENVAGGSRVRDVCEAIAPLAPSSARALCLNKKAKVQGNIWGTIGAIGGAITGGPLAAVGAATGGWLAGYYGSLLKQHGG